MKITPVEDYGYLRKGEILTVIEDDEYDTDTYYKIKKPDRCPQLFFKCRFKVVKEKHKYLIVSLEDTLVNKQVTPLLDSEALEERINNVSPSEEVVAVYKLETVEFMTSKKYTLV